MVINAPCPSYGHQGQWRNTQYHIQIDRALPGEILISLYVLKCAGSRLQVGAGPGVSVAVTLVKALIQVSFRAGRRQTSVQGNENGGA